MNCRGCQPTRVQPKIDLQRNWTKPEPSSLPSFLLGGSFWSSSLRFLECNYAAIGPAVLCFSGHSRKPKQGQRSIPLTFIWLPISHLSKSQVWTQTFLIWIFKNLLSPMLQLVKSKICREIGLEGVSIIKRNSPLVKNLIQPKIFWTVQL